MAHLLPPAGVDPIQKGDQFRFQRVFPGADDNPILDYSGIPMNIHDYKWTDYRGEEKECQEIEKRLKKQEAQQRQSHDNRGVPSHVINQEQRGRDVQRLGQYMDTPMDSDRVRTSSSCCDWRHPAGYERGAQEPPGTAHLDCLPGFGLPGTTRCVPADCSWRSRGSTQHVGNGWGFCPPICVDPRCLIRPRNKKLPDSTRPTGAPYFTHESKPLCTPPNAPLAEKGYFSYDEWFRTFDQRLPPECLRDGCLPSLCTWCAPIDLNCCPYYRDPRAYTIAKL